MNSKASDVSEGVLQRAREIAAQVIEQQPDCAGHEGHMAATAASCRAGSYDDQTAVKVALAALATLSLPSLEVERLEAAVFESVKREVEEARHDGIGFWRSCSGCYETSDGHNVNGYPYSEAFGCDLGGGCQECGGIGATWDTIDYNAMALDMLADDAALSALPLDGGLK